MELLRLETRLLGLIGNLPVRRLNNQPACVDVELDELPGKCWWFWWINPLIRCRSIIGHTSAADKRKVLQQVEAALLGPVFCPMTACRLGANPSNLTADI